MSTSYPPICLHPENPRYFLFRGQPRVLVCATEHYGSVINRPFDFVRYLDEAADKKQTLTRLFLLFRELQSARNPSSPCKPESPDFVAPWRRTGPGTALDGEPTYDLEAWNDEYFARLHRFLQLAGEREIVVEVTLFSNTYADQIWALNPLRAANNVNGIGHVEWADYTSLKEPSLVARQERYVRRILQETNTYDNIYYELCNEPGGGQPDHATPADVDAWQHRIAQVVRDEEARLPNHHLLFWSQAFNYSPEFEQPLDQSFTATDFDAVNIHPLPDMIYHGRRYMQGKFMARELRLGEIKDFCLATKVEPKPCVLDEDNSASLYRDEVGWTIHRKRAWTSVLNGCHYDYIDFSITVGSEAGTPASRRAIRSWMRNLSEFVHALDFVHARPDAAWLQDDLGEVVVSSLRIADDTYAAYIAVSREIGDQNPGSPLGGNMRLDLPPGQYHIATYSPTTGQYSPATRCEGGKPVEVELLPFVHDLALIVRRQASGAAAP